MSKERQPIWPVEETKAPDPDMLETDPEAEHRLGITSGSVLKVLQVREAEHALLSQSLKPIASPNVQGVLEDRAMELAGAIKIVSTAVKRCESGPFRRLLSREQKNFILEKLQERFRSDKDCEDWEKVRRVLEAASVEFWDVLWRSEREEGREPRVSLRKDALKPITEYSLSVELKSPTLSAGKGSGRESQGNIKEKELTSEQQEAILSALKIRFAQNKKLHPNVQWADVEKALKADPEKMWALLQLEITGGEPDVIGEDETGFMIGDCSKESPAGRRNVVFDRQAEENLVSDYPMARCNGNAADSVAEWGVDFMDELQYRTLGKRLPVDQTTRSWLKTRVDLREADCALSGRCDGRGGVYVSTDDVRSHHELRGFRCVLRIAKV